MGLPTTTVVSRTEEARSNEHHSVSPCVRMVAVQVRFRSPWVWMLFVVALQFTVPAASQAFELAEPCDSSPQPTNIVSIDSRMTDRITGLNFSMIKNR